LLVVGRNASSADGPEAFPQSVMSSVFEFLGPFVNGNGPDAYSGPMLGTGPARSFVREVERSFGLTLDWRSEATARDALARQLNEDQDLLAKTVDYALRNLTLGYDFQHAEDAASELARALQQSGSEFDVIPVDDGFGFQLRRRLTPTASAALLGATSTVGNAADHLKRAWDAAHGPSRNPTLAYSEAVKAVEAAAIPSVLPNDPLATLGKIIGQLRATAGGRSSIFTRNIGRSAPETPVELIVKLCDLLWTNQTDRHAAGDPHPAQPITQAQAEWAVQIAVLLVETFRSGAIS
jgi:hypothetical protein